MLFKLIEGASKNLISRKRHQYKSTGYVVDFCQSRGFSRCPLNDLFNNGIISGARSAYNSGDEARKVPPEKQWWVSNSSFTECFISGGPAEKLDEFVGYTDKPYTRDFRNRQGNIVKVEVINSAGFGRETVWTCYRDKAQCESEQVNATKSLADQYR